MSQEPDDRIARFYRRPHSYDYARDDHWRIFQRALNHRIALNAQARAQANNASPSSPTNAISSFAEAMADEDDEVGERASAVETSSGDGEAEDEDTAPSASVGSLDQIAAPAVPIAPTVSTIPPLTNFPASTGEPIYFLHGNTLQALSSTPQPIQDAVHALINAYIKRKRLAGGVASCINQRYDGQKTVDADGEGYACRDCRHVAHNNTHNQGYRVCIRRGERDIGGHVLNGFFVYAQRAGSGQIVWRST
jgi:hypothetical protein